MVESMNANQEKALEELGNPVWPEPSENFYHVRRNCLIGSSLILLLLYLITVSTASEQLHITLPFVSVDSIAVEHIYLPLLCVQGYLLIHFMSQAWLYVMEIRIRLTGTFDPTWGVMNSGKQDSLPVALKNARYSNLYNWWSQKIRNVKNFEGQEDFIKEIEQKISDFEEANRGNPNLLECVSRLHTIERHVNDLRVKTDRILQILTDEAPTILPRLKRFDNWIKCFTVSQWVHFLILEIMIPLTLAIAAFEALLVKLCH